MIKKAVIGALAIAMSSGVAHASDNQFTKEEGTGMFTGAAAGAIVGGPIGAAVGFVVGGILGDSMGATRLAKVQAQQLERELIDTRIALAQASRELAQASEELAQASQRAGGDELLTQLAERLHADVMFRTGKADLDAEVAGKIEALGSLLSAYAQLEVQLHGFADPRGNPERNLELSLERAVAVREALIKGGVAPEQIQVVAHGEDSTTAQEGDLEAYAWERRVSLSLRPLESGTVARSE